MIKSISTKSQAWGLDLVIALCIFVIGIMAFFLYSINFSSEGEEKLDYLLYDGNAIANILLSEGSPLNWNAGNVTFPGLISENKINETKLENFYYLVSSDYQFSKKTLNTKYDFYLFFPDSMNINGTIIDGIGKPGANRTNIVSDNLIKVQRVVVYQDKPIQLNLYIWD